MRQTPTAPSFFKRASSPADVASQATPPADAGQSRARRADGWTTFSHLGPGLIISAAIVGSGELIVTPKVGAANGFTLLWFIILACIVKVFVQIELARLAIFERVTTSRRSTIPGPRLRVSWVLWFWLFMYLASCFRSQV